MSSVRFLLLAFLFAMVPAYAQVGLVWGVDHVAAYAPGSTTERWSLDSGAPLFQPVQHDGIVYITSRSGLLRAVDALSGHVLWSFKSDDDWIYPPAVSGEIAVAVGRKSGLHAFDAHTGRQLWRRSLAQEPTYSPLLVGPRVIVQALFDGRLLAVDADTGRLRWDVRLATPALNLSADDGLILAGGYVNQVRALSAADGQLLWSRTLNGRVALPVVLMDGVLVVATDRPSLVLLNPADGHVLSETSIPTEPVELIQKGGGMLLVAADRRNKRTVFRVIIDSRRNHPPAQRSIRLTAISPKDELP